MQKLFFSYTQMGFPGGIHDKEPACQCRRRKRFGFDPWVGNIPWRRKWQATPVFLTGIFHRGAWWAKVHEVAKSQTGLRTSCVCVLKNEVGLLLQEKRLPAFVADDNSSWGRKESPKKKEEGKTVHCMDSCSMKRSSCDLQAGALVYVVVRKKIDLKSNKFNNAVSGIIVQDHSPDWEFLVALEASIHIP